MKHEDGKGTNQTHVVTKIEDIEKYLNPREQQEYSECIRKINDGRLKDKKRINTYAICNTDEPYYEDVVRVILEGEDQKA